MPVRVTVEISDEDWNDPPMGIRGAMEHLCGLIGIADEDWSDPIFQETWKDMVAKEVPRVVKIEETKRLITEPPRYARRRP